MNVAHTNLVRECLVALSPLGIFWSADTPGLVQDMRGNVFKAGVKGVSDIVGCVNGRFVAIECKTGAGDLSTAQRRFRDAVKRAGGLFLVARCVADVEAVKAIPA